MERVVRKHYPDLAQNDVAVISELRIDPPKDFMTACLSWESLCREKFSMLVAHDRALGQGYLLNVAHPLAKRSRWSQNRKYAEVLSEFMRYQEVLDRLQPQSVISVAIPKVAHLICRSKNVPVRILTAPRFGALYRWTEDETETCSPLSLALTTYVNKLRDHSDLPETKLNQSVFAQHFFAQYRYGHSSAIKVVFKRLIIESYQILKKTHTVYKDGYGYLGWCWPLLKKPYVFRQLKKSGVRPEMLDGRRVVLLPLHMEPEASLLNLSPEFNNSMELISWVSKSLPADAVLVVKEQPSMFGMRPSSYYANLQRMANVLVAHPEIHGREWLARCNMLVTITGTMGFEAVAVDKPVLSFGAHQVINDLPTVEYANSFDKTRQAISKLLDPSADISHLLKVSRVALAKAINDTCFDLSGYESLFKSENLHMDLAQRALDGLAKSQPEYGRTNDNGGC